MMMMVNGKQALLDWDDATENGSGPYSPLPNLKAEIAESRRLRRDLVEATGRFGFSLHFQPRVSLGCGRPPGAEALIRWPHRRRGMVSPREFMPLAEATGLAVPIGGWVLDTACVEAVNWPDATLLSVNVSTGQLADGVLLAQVAAALQRSSLPAERLELELTERMLIDMGTETLLTLSAIRDLGVGLALDDFGTGFASLALLKRLPLTAMKLDRTLVRALPGDREDAAIVRAVIATGHALGLSVVAEGIETEGQRAFLAGSGCDEGQGNLFSQPVPAEQVRPRLLCDA